MISPGHSNKRARQNENHQYETVNSLTNNVVGLENKVKSVQLKNKANCADKVNLVKKIQVFEKNQIDSRTSFVLQKQNTYSNNVENIRNYNLDIIGLSEEYDGEDVSIASLFLKVIDAVYKRSGIEKRRRVLSKVVIYVFFKYLIS